MTPLRHALSHLEAIQARLRSQQVAVFLDYDGTLSPIVARPELAVLSVGMRQTIVALAKKCPVAIISGRSRPDVEAMVKIPGLTYAGSHGFDIKGPGLEMIPAEVQVLLPKIAEAYEELVAGTKGIEGCLVENKTYALAVHYRLVDPKVVPQIEALVDEVVGREAGLKKTGGKMIFEIRANLPWDKGKALEHVLAALGLQGSEVLPFYLGDDETDEDAFRAIKKQGIGILVAEAPQASAARYYLKDVAEVEQFLGQLSHWID